MIALVTGATGFVGAAVCRKLLEHGFGVRALIRESSDLRNLARLQVETVSGDLRDTRSLESALRGCDVLFHVAADYRLWVPDPDSMYAANVEGTRNLIDAAMRTRVQRIVYTSSVAVITPNADGTPADENTISHERDMVGHYKRSKFLAERVVDEAVARSSAPVVIVNPSTPVGPGDIKPTPTGRIVLDALNGRIPGFVDTGLNIVHVDDVAEGHLLALEKGQSGRRYILGGENLSLQEMLNVIAKLAGRNPPRLRIPHSVALLYAGLAESLARLTGGEPGATIDGVRMSEKKMFYSSLRAAEELGYAWRPPEQALEDAVEWFRLQSGVDAAAKNLPQ